MPCFVMAGGWLYILSNRADGTLYVGVTSDLIRRAWEHSEGVANGFSKRHGLKPLVYFERFDDVRDAIRRERNIKHWPRAWKVRLIHTANQQWDDLYESIV